MIDRAADTLGGLNTEQIPAVHIDGIQKYLIRHAFVGKLRETGFPRRHSLLDLLLFFRHEIAVVIYSLQFLPDDPVLRANQEFSAVRDHVKISFSPKDRVILQHFLKRSGIHCGDQRPYRFLSPIDRHGVSKHIHAVHLIDPGYAALAFPCLPHYLLYFIIHHVQGNIFHDI